MQYIETPEVFTFPKYLGFGKLNLMSMGKIYEDGINVGTSADYSLNGEVVYYVEQTDKLINLIEYFKGKQISETHHKTLELAFFGNLHVWLKAGLENNPRFRQIFRKIGEMSNTLVIPPTMDELYLYFPAGFIFFLQQPINQINKNAWVKLEMAFRNNNEECFFQIESFNPGEIYRFMDDRRVTREPLMIARLGCTLFNLFDTVEMCQNLGLIPTQKEYRMTITDACSAMFPGNLFEGDKTRGIRSFAVFEYGTGNGKILKENADELFLKMCGGNL